MGVTVVALSALILTLVMLAPLRLEALVCYKSQPLLLTASFSWNGRRFAALRTTEARLRNLFSRITGDAVPDLSLNHIRRLSDALIAIKQRVDSQIRTFPRTQRAFSRLRDSLRIERFRVQATLGSTNPVLAGEYAGAAWALFGILIFFARRSGRFDPSEPRLSVTPDFNSPSLQLRVLVRARAPIWLFLYSLLRYKQALHNPVSPRANST